MEACLEVARRTNELCVKAALIELAGRIAAECEETGKVARDPASKARRRGDRRTVH